MGTLQGIDTGYEAKFDFPTSSTLPTCRYLLASVPRTGSTFLSHLLWETGCLGAPLEYLNFLPGSPYDDCHGNPEAQISMFERVLATRTSPNGVFGLKVFPVQLEELMGSNPGLVDGMMRLMFATAVPNRVVQLRRRDKDAHAISYARAALSGRWRAEQESDRDAEPEFSAQAVADAAAELDRQEARWQAMYSDLRIEPLELWYEDVVAAPDTAIAAVAEYLGVTLQPEARVHVPRIRRQSQSGASSWAEQLNQRSTESD